MPEYKTREELIQLLREAIDEQGITQSQLAEDLTRETELLVHQQHVSAALTHDTAKMDYLREAMAERLLGGSWERGILFWKTF